MDTRLMLGQKQSNNFRKSVMKWKILLLLYHLVPEMEEIVRKSVNISVHSRIYQSKNIDLRIFRFIRAACANTNALKITESAHIQTIWNTPSWTRSAPVRSHILFCQITVIFRRRNSSRLMKEVNAIFKITVNVWKAI